MNRVRRVLAGSALTALTACENPVSPSSGPPVIYATAQQGSVLARIDTTTGTATVIGSFNVEGAFGLARRSDGVLYTVTDSGFTPNPNARLATVDPRTGAATIIGQPFGQYLRMMGLAVSPSGALYGSSPITNSLYRLDLQSGLPMLVGPFGVGGVMDLAYDPGGNLWANTMTAVFRVDEATGSATLAARVEGAMSLMGIAFDANGALYATNYAPESALYRIDPASGAATLVGMTGQSFVHSAELVGGRR